MSQQLIYLSVPTLNDLRVIEACRRDWGMIVVVYNDDSNNGSYVLLKKNDVIGDNTNWEKVQFSDDSTHFVTGKSLFNTLNSIVDVSVPTVAERDNIQTFRRKWGMIVTVFDDTSANNGLYILYKKTANINDNENWSLYNPALEDTSSYITGKTLFNILYSHFEISVATIVERDAIEVFRRRWGMRVYVYDDGEMNGFYFLKKQVDNIGSNLNWARWYESPASIGFGSKYSATDQGQLLEMSIDDDFLYICVQAGEAGNASWKRAPLRVT